MSDNEEDANLPSAQECEKRCQEFASITGTDTALAMFYLQDREWSLERALNSYFEQSLAESQEPMNSSANAVVTSTASAAPQASVSDVAVTGSLKQNGSSNQQRMRVLSWNIDGLDKKNLRSRVVAVCDTIKREDPHVVFLQEVVEASQDIIEELCPLYHLIPGGEREYYTAILVKIGEVQVEETKILPFPKSAMMRNLLCLKCTVKGVKCFMLTSHLESTKDYSAARKEQLTQCFKYIEKRDQDRTVVFGGDLNLRDKEVTEIGGLPENIYDIWEVTGKRNEAKFTWDQMRNDNLEMSGNFKPRSRFDRLYVRHAEKKTVKPVYFELCGLERLKSCQRFCSDHWALLAHFDIL